VNLLARISATGFFIGYIPFAPGTFGSIFAVIVYLFVPGSDSVHLLWWVLILFFVGVWSAARIEKMTGIEDNGIIVIDEIAGQLVALLLVGKSLKWLAIGLILFRLFDIIKPFPARQSESLKSGWGVMTDDIIAGVYTAVCLQILKYVLG
jgi:phosphatidylglycerophosphatase A